MAALNFAMKAVATTRPVLAKSQVRSFASRPIFAQPLQTRRVARVPKLAAAKVDEVLAEVQKIIAEQLGKDKSEVTADSKFSDLGADSLDTVEIMMALEEQFELELDEEGAEKISTVQEAADLIASQLKD